MSISNAVATALSGLNVTARKAEIVSSNVSNALTEGYGRRSVSVSSADLGGVRIDGVSRHVNEGVIRERRLAEAGLRPRL
jgi:Flagellar hook-associated protein